MGWTVIFRVNLQRKITKRTKFQQALVNRYTDGACSHFFAEINFEKYTENFGQTRN